MVLAGRFVILSHHVNLLRPAVRSISATQRPGQYDIVVVGGGIVGVATAREILERHPQLRVAIVEKEARLAAHQSGRNSGVVHAGIYYQPGSLKAKLCVEGLQLCYEYFDKKAIPYKKCGKLIVATSPIEVERLHNLHERGLKNSVPDLQLVEKDKIREIEPHCRGHKALWSPHTGIVDYVLVTQHYADDFKKNGGQIYFDFEVDDFHESSDPDHPVVVSAKCGKKLESRFVLTCGGLHSDRLADISGCSTDPRIVPFRGEYLLLRPEKCHMIRGNIYPVPDPRFPFLGVHFTPRMDGSVWLGPNAVLAFKREGYNWSDVHLSDLFDVLKFPGFQRLTLKYASFGISEAMKSWILQLQVKQLQKFVPELSVKDVTRGPAGVRAQAMNSKGELVDDFVFDKGESSVGKRVLHCRNAPSPGATSSMAIAKMVVDRMEKEFHI